MEPPLFPALEGMSAANTVVENGGRVVLLVAWFKSHVRVKVTRDHLQT